MILTLGAQGALIKNHTLTRHVPAVDAGPVVETTGAGDAFNGGLATALSEGMNLVEATQFACAVAGISVTRPGTAPSMPHRPEIDALRARQLRSPEKGEALRASLVALESAQRFRTIGQFW